MAQHSHSMTRADWVRLGSMLAIIVAGIVLITVPFRPVKDIIKLGLDLQGGVRLVLEGEGVAAMTPTQQTETIDRTIEILQNRVDSYGLANAEIRRYGSDRILVNVPGASDPEQARRLIGQTAVLEFHHAIQVGASATDELTPSSSTQEVLYTSAGIPVLVDREVLLTGAALSNAEAKTSTQAATLGQSMVALTFNQDGAEQFASVVRDLGAGQMLAIVLDDVVQSYPVLQESIVTAAREGWRNIQNSATISGSKMSGKETKTLAAVLRAGALPVSVKIAEETSIGASLGSDSIRHGMMSMAIGFVLILIYMFVLYRRMGTVANAALLINMVIIIGGLIAFGAVLTMAGIAGIVLTIGMTVDSNIIIFERIKEERRTGKTPIAAVRAGYERSLAVITDTNVTTLVTAAILLVVGSGPFRGFAITLALGIVGTVYCALVPSRFLLERGGFWRFIPVRMPQPEK
jgi:preprotein translocase subunit SecD